MAENRRAEGMPTFAAAAAHVVEQKRAGWHSHIHARTWLTTSVADAQSNTNGSDLKGIQDRDDRDDHWVQRKSARSDIDGQESGQDMKP